MKKLFGTGLNFSLQTKFILTISSVLICSIIIISSYLIYKQSEGFQRELESSSETMIRILSMQAESGVLFESTYELEELLSQLQMFDDVTYAYITNNEGDILAEYGQRPESKLIMGKKLAQHHSFDDNNLSCNYITAENGEVFAQHSRPVFTRIETVDRESLGITNRLNESVSGSYTSEKIGSLTLLISLENLNQSIKEAQTAAILITILVVILTIVVLFLFVRMITKPILMLVAVTDQVSHGDLSQQVHVNRSDEIGDLAMTFNRMIQSLKESREEIENYNRTLEGKIVERTNELEQTQAQLVQSEKMSAIGQLAAGVAHELNNPLGGILGYAQFSLEKMKKTPAEKTGEKELCTYIRYLTDIEAQARRCKNIVQNLLRFSRSSHTTDFAEVDIVSVVEDTMTFVEHQLHMNQVEVGVEAADNIPIIEANGGQLQQVFTNLIINAMHASPPETKILITIEHKPKAGKIENAVVLKITDQGTGISEENMNKIFEPFFTTKEVGKGTGLGLSVSYGIIKDHGGEISVESVIDQGTTFTIILPVQNLNVPADKNTSNVSIS